MPIPLIFLIVILFAAVLGYVGYRSGGSGLFMVSLAGIGVVVAFLLMRLMHVF